VNRKITSRLPAVLLLACFGIFLVISIISDYQTGMQTGRAFYDVCLYMLRILPCSFILIALLEVWIKPETVVEHLGENCGWQGNFWVMVLAGFSIGGLYVAYPMAQTLQRKGASLRIIFSYLAFTGILRIPMTLFEITFLGLPFTLTRLLVALPLFLLSGILFGTVLTRKNYRLKD